LFFVEKASPNPFCLEALETYEQNAKSAIDAPLTVEVSDANTPQHHQLRFLRSTLAELNRQLSQ
jgi:hypothetical protein